MPDEDVHLPLSGAVAITQSFFPVTVNVGRSGDQKTEKDILSVASYGRQLGRIGEALEVLLKHYPIENLASHEKRILDDLRCMLRQIAMKKK